MLLSNLVSLIVACSTIPAALAAPATAASSCTSAKRLAGARLIPDSYNMVAPGASAAGFAKLPLKDNCMTYINPNGGPAIPVAVDATTTRDFALNTRQLFSKVTGEYTDNADGITIIHTNVTLGALHAYAIPVTFYADVYLHYDLSDCLMQKIQAFATIPTVIAGVPIQPPILDQLLAAIPQ